MSDDAGVDDAITSGDEPTLEGETLSAGRPDSEPVPHSALVGFMSVPVHRWLPIRRSTLLMAVAFLGFGALCLIYPPYSAPDSRTSVTAVIPSVAPATTTTTTTTTVPPTTTTTTTPPRSSTTSASTTGSSTSTTRPATTTTTVRGTSVSTTTVPTASTLGSSGNPTTTGG